MNPQRMIGIVLVVVGVVLFIMGLNASDSVADRFSKFFTGHFTDTTVWYLVGGVISTVAGLSMAMIKGNFGSAR